MKSKNLLIPILFFAIIMLGCGCKKQPTCNDEQTIMLLRKVIYNQLNQLNQFNQSMDKFLLNNIQSKNLQLKIKDLIDNYIHFEAVRPVSINEEIQKCDCVTDLTIGLSPKMKSYIDNNEMIKQAYALLKMKQENASLKYSAQIFDDNNLIVEAKFDKDLTEVIWMYIILSCQADGEIDTLRD